MDQGGVCLHGQIWPRRVPAVCVGGESDPLPGRALMAGLCYSANHRRSGKEMDAVTSDREKYQGQIRERKKVLIYIRCLGANLFLTLILLA